MRFVKCFIFVYNCNVFFIFFFAIFFFNLLMFCGKEVRLLKNDELSNCVDCCCELQCFLHRVFLFASVSAFATCPIVARTSS